MHISFDSIAELRDFLDFAHEIGNMMQRAQAPSTPDAEKTYKFADRLDAAVDDPDTLIDTSVEAATALSMPVDNATGCTANELAVPGEAEPAKRKRRTKAEMEAARAAEQAGNTDTSATGSDPASGPADAAAGQALSPAVDANPFAASGSTNLAQIMQQAVQTAGTLAEMAKAQAAPAADPVTWIPARAAELGPIDAVTHMRKCREFIAAKGQAVYQKTFALAGTGSNVMSFSPEQCAAHLAAQEYLLANPEA